MAAEPDKEIKVTEIILIVRNWFFNILSQWHKIALITILSGILGICYAWLTPAVYIAEMSFVTENESGGRMNAYAGLAAQFGIDLGGGNNNSFEGENLIELLKSRNLVERTLLTKINDRELLIDYYLINNNIISTDDKKKAFFKFEESSRNNTRQEDSLLAKIYKQIIKTKLEVYKKDKKLSQIVIRMKDNNEYFAKQFTELLAATAIQYYTDYKSKRARQNVEILQRQADSVRGMLFGSMNQVASLADLNVNPNRQTLRTGIQRKQIDVQVNSVLYAELLKNLELAKLSLRKETPLIQIIDNPKYPLEKKKPGRFFTGIIFAFIGGFLSLLFFSLKFWYFKTIEKEKNGVNG